MEAQHEFSIPDVLEQLEEYLNSLESGAYVGPMRYVNREPNKGRERSSVHFLELKDSPVSINVEPPVVDIVYEGERFPVDFMAHGMISNDTLVLDLPGESKLEMRTPLKEPGDLISHLVDWVSRQVASPAEQSKMGPQLQEAAVELVSETTQEIQEYRDDAILWNDYSSSGDLLNRTGFALFLAKSIDELWTRNWHDDGKVRPSTIFNVYGRWGSGKTTFVRMVTEQLKSLERPQKIQPWKDVHFNAWQSQHIEPVWWSLLERITVGLITAETSRARRWWLRFREWFWRVGNSYGLYLMAIALVLFGVGLIPDAEGPLIARLQVLADGLDAIMAATSVGVILVQSLLMGSASSARLFQMTRRDPMKKVGQHFRRVLDFYPDTPVLVFIDDLDRCRTEYVVSLLECMQTLLSDKQVFYVVAADRKWISGSFDAYAEIQDERLSGGSHGYHFVEKIFQLSIGLPAITRELREKLIKHLVNDEEPEVDNEQDRERIRRQFASAASEEELSRHAVNLKSEGVSESVIAEEATMMSSDVTIQQSRQHRLTRFTSLFEPNARSVKLVVNAYGVYINLFRTSGVLDLDPERLDQIALWAILNVRFPRAAELIEENPHLIDDIRSGKSGQHEQERGLKHPDIKTVLDGGQTGSSLTPQVVLEMLGRVPGSLT